jgi:DNA polymerase III subunit epsilon
MQIFTNEVSKFTFQFLILLYAIVDIETTGGYAAASGITEIAVYVSDGKKIVDRFHTMVNPVYTIPPYVEALTGITNAMVENERTFGDIAEELFNVLNDKIFVAHNVNFDFSFIKYYLAESGYYLNSKKLCTVRLSRKILPGLSGYGLGRLCKHLNIPIENRHRAGGDAMATTILFHHLMKSDNTGVIPAMLKVKSKEHFLPPNVPEEMITRLPGSPGVYYFQDKKGKTIYVGKAKNLSRRVNSHFSNNKTNRQKQEFLKKIYSIEYTTTATELMAFILESIEIKKIWPEQNRSQKRFEQTYGLYAFEDRRGYLRLCIEKKRKNITPFYTFGLLIEGHNLLVKLCKQFQLCPKKCFLQADNTPCLFKQENNCEENCEQNEDTVSYNHRVQECLLYLQNELPSFAILEEGLNHGERSCILMEKGRFYGMGYVPDHVTTEKIEELKGHITPYSENEYIRGLIYAYAARYPYKKVALLT